MLIMYTFRITFYYEGTDVEARGTCWPEHKDRLEGVEIRLPLEGWAACNDPKILNAIEEELDEQS